MNEFNQRRELSAELVGYQLGLGDAQDRRRLEAVIGDAKSLASACKRIERIVQPLDLDNSPAVPENLVASILNRVNESGKSIPFPKYAAAGLPTSMEIGGRGPRFNFRELVGLAAAIALFIGIFVPGYRTARNAAQRAMCADNMRLIGNGYAQYADMFGNPLPSRGSVPIGASWLPTANPGARRYANSQNPYILVSKRFVTPNAFVCPGRPHDTPLETISPEKLNDFPDSSNNSYSTTLVPETWQQKNFDPQMPLAADMNPLVDDAQELLVNGRVPENSSSHGAGRGQNVLRANLSVNWCNTPRVGIDNDDIYRLIGVQKYTGQEWPRLRSDAFLIP
jgi:hypothetical protein